MTLFAGDKIIPTPAFGDLPRLAFREGGGACWRQGGDKIPGPLNPLLHKGKRGVGDKTTKYVPPYSVAKSKGGTQVANEWRQNSPPLRGEVLSSSPPPLLFRGRVEAEAGSGEGLPFASPFSPARGGGDETRPSRRKGFVVATGSSFGGVA